MKGLLLVVAFFVSWFALLGILGIRRDGPGPAPQGIVDRAIEGLALLRDWGKYMLWIAGGAFLVWALLIWPYTR